jgi:hypothetical protein
MVKLKEILDKFSNSTGLRINYHKTSMVPINISGQRCQELANILSCKVETLPFTYLGQLDFQWELLNPEMRTSPIWWGEWIKG